MRLVAGGDLQETEEGTTVVGTYVDDLLATATQDKLLDDFHRDMQSLELKCLGELENCLGMRNAAAKLHMGGESGNTTVEVTRYTDADFAADKNTRKSVSGALVTVGGAPFGWQVKQQSRVALFAAEAEFAAVAVGATEVLGITNLLIEIGVQVKLPMNMIMDNPAAIKQVAEASRDLPKSPLALVDASTDVSNSFTRAVSSCNNVGSLTKKLHHAVNAPGAAVVDNDGSASETEYENKETAALHEIIDPRGRSRAHRYARSKITHTATSATMGRPRINGQGKKRKSYQRAAVAYSHKQEILNYIESGHNLHETIEKFYGKFQRKDHRPFILTPPNRVDITEWMPIRWGDLSIETIVSGFAKVGFLTDTRVAEAMSTDDAPQIESYIVEEHENCKVVGGEVGSDDDIENESDSDDEINLKFSS
ncbi:unnamed protein product [Phytophthora fragariaefolia]|uniref:Unnamed protein product n=1 Tax=Phytophthora fragariaefolia TaxID=1490495 RepID=A0A9W6XS97_9STRA|nr:unnamed protein product [Phytophthora fragariaefolia]